MGWQLHAWWRQPGAARAAVVGQCTCPCCCVADPSTHLAWQVALWRHRLRGGRQPQVGDASCLQVGSREVAWWEAGWVAWEGEVACVWCLSDSACFAQRGIAAQLWGGRQSGQGSAGISMCDYQQRL